MIRFFKPFVVVSLLLLWGQNALGQINYSWTSVPIDSLWDDTRDLKATEIISKYEPKVASLMEIIGYSVDEYESRRPESPLSNFAADIIREYAGQITGKTIDFARTNFGGIRSNLPKGAVRVYDIYSIFPFENTIVVLEIKGSNVKKILNKLAQGNRFEAMSGIEIVAKDRKLVKALIGGKPVQDNKLYRFATINFLIEGNSGEIFKKNAENIEYTDVVLRDAITNYIKQMTARDEKIDLKCDGRMVINKK